MTTTLGLLMVGVAEAPHATPGAIQDNSFLVEEAYNQEAGVVQHIQVLNLDPKSGDWAYVFTDEWPVGDELDQLSVTIPVTRAGKSYGLGDVMLNYRRELYHGDGDSFVVTPRISFWLPTGDPVHGFGEGVPGLQVLACVSARVIPALATHSNLGVATPFSGRDATAGTFFTAAQSLIWLVHPRFNILAEIVWTEPALRRRDGGRVTREVVVSPGLRTAIDFDSGLQIVPGLAAPVRFEGSTESWGALIYLSFEHHLSHPSAETGP